MLRVTINETAEELAINLEGRIAGPWAAELGQIWRDTASRRESKPVSLDLRNVTYVDEDGKQVLRQIESETRAELIAITPWTRRLVAEIRNKNTND